MQQQSTAELRVDAKILNNMQGHSNGWCYSIVCLRFHISCANFTWYISTSI